MSPNPSPGATLFGKSREAIIGLLFSQPAINLHVREIARRSGFSAPTVALELRRLAGAGVLLAEVQGRQLLYRPNPVFPLFGELKSIATKTWGIQGRIAVSIGAIPDISCSFIFGSFASGTAHAASDIDLLVIGDADYPRVAAAADDASLAIGRPVSVKLYREAEWRKKLREGNRFIAETSVGPKLFLVGDEGVLDAIGQPRTAGGAKAARSASSAAAGDRKPSRNRARFR